MALPVLTDEQRAENLKKAQAARAARSALLDDLKNRRTTLRQVFELADREPDGVAAKTRVAALVRALPGVGDVGVQKAMESAEIAAKRKVRGVGANQRRMLLAALDTLLPTVDTGVPAPGGQPSGVTIQ
ncbi:integration host factor, actinobacterial type [Saccharothrix sp. HUAS TT10]|uniref:integration host factor, actinobacterial type n=1 Tax=Saccharothrix sp. HUAS TT10 TaxID=3447450 RepID=UPI003F6F2742